MIILTLGGLNYGKIDRLDTALKGYATREGQRVPVVYPQADNKQSILTGITQLDTAIRIWTPLQQVTVVAHSQGAEVVSEWLERYADRADAPLRGQLRFILLGNPCRRLGGVVTAGNWFTKHGYLGWRKPTPDDTQYDIDDITRRGDVWSNADGWPTMIRPKVSLWDKLLGRDPHLNYDNVDPAKCTLRERVGNTRYLVSD